MPSSHVLPIRLLNINEDQLASGRCSNVFRGTFRGKEVCVKRLRVDSTGSPEKVKKGHTHHTTVHRSPFANLFQQMAYQEAMIRRRLKHANVVPFIGVTFAPLQIISEWMSGGDLTTHIKSNPHRSRIALVSPSLTPTPRNVASAFSQLSDVAEGLNYLHQCDVVHGDLKGVGGPSPPNNSLSYRSPQLNIVVDASGRAHITGFSLARGQGISEEVDATASGTGRWTAPEILQGRGAKSKQADVFSFAMVMVEVGLGRSVRDQPVTDCLHARRRFSLAPLRSTCIFLSRPYWP